MLKTGLYVIVFLFVSHSNAQSTCGCKAIEASVISIKDSLGKVFVEEELEPFSIKDYNEFQKKFENLVDNDVLKKAYSLSKVKRGFNLDKCELTGLLVSRKEADSLRASNKNFPENNRRLNDSLNKALNEIIAIANKTEREEKYNSFVSSESYKKIAAEMESSINRIILIGQPIIVESKYIFFTLYLGDRSRDFISSIYFYKKQGPKWDLIKIDTW